MSSFALLLAGFVDPTPQLRARLRGRRILAADGGIAHALSLGLEPELWVGDFDSTPRDLEVRFAGVARRTFPPDKDATDAELAAEAALALGASDLLIVGALGGRTDHAFSNLVLLLRLAGQGVGVALADGRECAYALSDTARLFPAAPGAAFSVLRFGPVQGLSVENARWPLREASVPFLSILTQSNEALGPIRAGLRQGQAVLLIQDRQSPGRPD